MTPASPPIPDAAGVGRPGPNDCLLPVDAQWDALLLRVRQRIDAHGADPGRVLVLVPYAQMMDAGRRAWARHQPQGFAPRFESTRNWAASLQPFLPGPTDMAADGARDSLIAASLLDRVAGRQLDPGLRATLVSRLVDTARQLAPLAAAQAPADRARWEAELRPQLATGSALLQWEGLVASVALAWAGLSGYATDALWSDQAAPGVTADLLLLLPGFQNDPLAEALLARWGGRGLSLEWPESRPDPVAIGAIAPWPEPVCLHACDDAEDEAGRAAACVLAHVQAERQPVALVALDRLLTRRIGALLAGAGLSVRDETGWKLSTTHAAARVISLLRAADRHARTDAVLDWLKQAQRWPDAAVDPLERLVRLHGLPAWRSVPTHPDTMAAVPDGVVDLLAGLQAARPLRAWLENLAQALRDSGDWDALAQDAAGQRVIEVLRLQAGAAHELAALTGDAAEGEGPAPASRRWSLPAFTAWVRDALEAASFLPEQAGRPQAQVVVLPLAQLLGRAFAATVAPGCDEAHLPVSPEPPGTWRADQRALLGLPDRPALAQAAAQAWAHLLTQPRLDLLWRRQDQGDAVLPAAWVRALAGRASGGRTAVEATDPRTMRTLPAALPPEPLPVAGDLLPEALSASAYQDLRDCPYRFFALRQLRLQSADEIEAGPDKRDMGNWLHAVLRAFHEGRESDDPARNEVGDRTRLDSLALVEARRMGLMAAEGQPASDDSAAFLPFLASWPALRDGYLAWLAGYEQGGSGPRFHQAEQAITQPLGPWRLYGKLDRIDRAATGEGAGFVVLDYKTEPRLRTQDRVKEPLEDTQIAFYAALMGAAPGDLPVRGGYLSITDSRDPAEATRFVEQTELAVAREHLLHGIRHDLERIGAGHPLPPLGEGRACEHCAARGLCRRDFREGLA